MEGEDTPLLGHAGHARNYRQRNIPTSKLKTRLALGGILLTETLERIAFYGLVGNLVIFLNSGPFNWTFYSATNALFVFMGMSYMWSLLGGWIADSCLGKFPTISLFFVVYIAGYIVFPFLYPHPNIHDKNITEAPSWCRGSGSFNGTIIANGSNHYADSNLFKDSDPPTSDCAWAVYLALTLMAIANGAVKANISPFGADQVKHEGPNAIRMYVNWFYWCINIGALISLGGLSYVQQEISFFWGYVAPNISLVLATVIFVSCVCFYKRKPARGSILTNITKIVFQSCTRSCCHRRPQTDRISHGSSDLYRYSENPPTSCLDYAKIQYGGSYHDNMVDDVKTLGKICLIFIGMIPYWIAYFQMETTFLIQGLHMRLDFDSKNGTKAAAEDRPFKIPAAWLSLFDVIFLIILLPIFNALYPVLDRRGYVLSPRLRIIIGMMFSMVAVATAGMVERYRLDIYWKNDTENIHYQLVGQTFYLAADMTIMFQIPQYALIGISEVFASVAGLELAYVLAPRSMQGLITGLFWFTQGVGSMLGTVIIYGFRGTWFFNWDHGDINCRHVPCGGTDSKQKCSCHLDYYFFFLAGLQVLGLLMFYLIAWRLDVGSLSAYRRKHDDSFAGDSVDGNTNNTTNRPGYRTFARRPTHTNRPARRVNIETRPDSAISETDTIDTDNYLSDPH